MSALSGIVAPLLKIVSREVVGRTMERAEASVVEGMRSKGMTPDVKPLRDCTRDALFRLWRKVIPSGDLADAVRDYMDTRVVALVEDRVGETPTLEAVVTATREATISVIEDLT